jgi:uncharacterized paraquat-inducible protein A
MKVDETLNEEEYVVCRNCDEVVPKRYNYCPRCGARLFHLVVVPLLLVAGGFYFLNAILLIIFFAPHLLTITIFEVAAGILISLGIKRGAFLGLLLSALNTIFLFYLVLTSFNYVVLLMMIIHLVSAYLIVHEWENLE